ncbi:MAG: type III-B CRISPR module-associated protein Cmr5 [Polyangiaceae bacterium]|jgi:CRISPR-associated protein Cmr5|nr:type III-B CRISPR module-associated protein Cmr5 [Polyangiaceae bacterium]
MSDARASQHVRRAQDQARIAWNWVDSVSKDFGDKDKDRYATLARKLPSYLQVSGLGQTMAFLYAKAKSGGAEGGEKDQGDRAAGTLLKQLRDYLRNRFNRRDDDAMGLVVGLDPSEYRRATQELMQMADWLKRFAEGRLGTGGD